MRNDEFIWAPSGERVARSNLKRFMDSEHIQSFSELQRRSSIEVEWFWDAVNKDLKIEWYQNYDKVLDLSRGIQWAKWFVGGKINIAHNCVDKHASNQSRSKIAIISEKEKHGESRRVSYQRLFEMTNQIANALTKLKVGRGDKVGLFMPMFPETIASFLAILKVGAVVVPIFSGYGAQAISTRLQDCEANVLLTAKSFSRKGKIVRMLEVALEASRLTASIRALIVFDNPAGKENSTLQDSRGDDFETLSWKEILHEPKTFKTKRMSSEDPCIIIYTSGTSGKPKGAVHVHAGLQVKITEEVAYQADVQPDDIIFWFTDIGWIMAPWEIIGVLSLGGTILIYDGAPDHPYPDRLWQVVDDDEVTFLGVSPTLIRGQMRYGPELLEKHDLSTLRSFGSTGEPWNPESYLWLFEKVGKRRCPIINLSGGTEVGACFLSVHPVLPVKVCSLGGPSLGIDADVFDEYGNPVRGQTGELVVKKPWPSMTRGLWKDEKRYLETYWSRFKDVWVHGDWASVDQDGYWYLHGRSDDTLKIAGKRVGPAEIESALGSHKAVLESIAIGVPDSLKGEAAVCFVVLRPGYSPSSNLAKDLQNQVANMLGPAMRPSSIKFVDLLPKTRNAKLVRRLVRAKFLNFPLGDLSNLENPEALDLIANAR